MTYSRGLHVPSWLRRTWLVGVLITLAALAGAMSADAQGSPLSVADFEQSGLETVVLASFDAGGDTTLYSAADSRWGAAGSLVEGDVPLDDDTSITRVMLPNSDGSLLRLNDNGGLTLRDFFGQSGAGADLTVWVQTSSGTASFAASDVRSAGGNYVNFNVPTSNRAVLSGIGTGDRFLLALTRPAPNTAATGDPTITGTARVGETLTAGTGAIADGEGLDNVAYSYQWLADDTDITGATASTYILTVAEEGKAIKVKVSFNDDDGNDEERTSAATVAVAAASATNTAATGAPTITGTAQVGETLTAGTSAISDAEGLTNVAYTYQWLADDTGITDATASSYTLVDGDQGKTIKVKVSFSDDDGNEEQLTSTATAAVEAAAAAAAMIPAVSVSEPPSGDLAAGTSTAGVVAPNAAALGMIREVAGWSDTDWFKAELTAKTSYVIEVLSASTEGCTLLAPVLKGIHNASGTLIDGTEWSNAERDNIYTELTFTPDTTGTHYIAVTGEPSVFGTYILALTAGGNGSAQRITAIGEQGCFPEAPSGLGTSGIAHNSVTLSWTAPDTTGITGYQVLRGASATSLSAIQSDTGSTATTYTDSSAAASTTYHYAVAAITTAGPGLPSITAMTTTPANTPGANTAPGATGLTLSQSFDRVTLTWSAPTGTVSGYQVWRGTAAASLTVLVANTGSTDTSYVDETAAAETEYHYAVAGINSNGTGPKSTASTTTLAAPVVTVVEPTIESTPEPEPLIAAQQQEAEIVTFVTNLGQGPGDRTTITTSTDTGRATHDQGFTTGSGNSLFLLESLEVQALVNSDFLGASIWTDNNGSIGDMLFDLGRVGGSEPTIYSAADVYLLPNTKYWVRFEAQEFTLFAETEPEAKTVGLFGADLDDEDSGGLPGWTIDGRVKVSLKGRVIDLGATVSFSENTLVTNFVNSDVAGSNISIMGQPFTTGNDRYILTSVKFKARKEAGVTPNTVVSMREDVSGKPSSTVLYTLTGSPITATTATDYTYTPPPNATLKANTTYWIVFQTSAGSVQLRRPSSSGSSERVGSGWSINTRHFIQANFNQGGSWIFLEIKGKLPPSPERLETGDLPASKDTYMSLSPGQTAVASLSSSSDTDWIKFEGLQNRKQYRLDVEFLGTGARGGGFSFHSGNPNGTPSPNGSFWGSNWSGNAVLDFKVLDAHDKTYWVEIVSANGENVGDITRNKVDGKLVSITVDHDPSTIHVGDYVVTLSEIGHVQKMVSNLDQGFDDRYKHAIVGHRYSQGLDNGHQRFLGYFTDQAVAFITGPNITGYTLDRIHAQVQMGLTKITGHEPTVSRSYIITFSRARLLVTEGDVNGSTYTVRLNAEPSEDVVVSITGQSGTDLTVTPTSLTFTTTNWDQAQTVTVTAAADADALNDDVTLTLTPTGEQFLVTAFLAVRVDDIEDPATAELPAAPTGTVVTPPQTIPFLSLTARRTNANPVISLYDPGSAFSPGKWRCTFKSNDAYTSRLYSPGPADTDVIYAGDCADVTLAPETSYWIVFENYNEIPRTSVYNADDFYYVAHAANADEDPDPAAGWSIRDDFNQRRYTLGDREGWNTVVGRRDRPFLIGVYASPAPSSSQKAAPVPEETEAEDLALQSATVDGATLTLTYDGTLDVGATPSSTAFTVNVNEAERNIFIVGLGGTSVLLTLSSAVESGDTVTVAYAKPSGANVIKDTDGNEADSFTAQAVTNNTAAPVTENSDPVQTPGSLTVNRHESGKLSASWDAPGTGPTPTGYTVQWKESEDDWAVEADVSESDVTGTSHTIAGLTDGTEYAVRVNAREGDDDSDPSAEVTATPQETVPPAPSSAAVDGATLTITFSEALDTAEVPDKSAFAVTVAGSSRGVDSVSVSGSAVTLTLVTAVSSGEAVTVDYTAPSGEADARLQDLVGNAAASFSGQAVTNNTTPLQAPGSLNVNRHESGKLRASWDAPGTGPTPTGYTVQWKESGDDWATAADVSESDVTGTSHTITGLTDGTEYSVRVISRKGDDDSDPSAEVTATPQETVAPAPSSAAVDGATLTITFSEALDTGQTPGTSAFGVSVAGSSRGVEAVSVSGSAVTLTLASAVSSGEAVTVDYTTPSGEADARLQDLVGNEAASFSGQAVTNNTAAVIRLTASVSAVATSHDGSSRFTFEVWLSEEPKDGFSYKTMKNHAFTVTGGRVTKADRLNRPSNVGWRIYVTPVGNSKVTIVLPVTTDCDADGAICTQDSRMLSSRVEITVPGPGG